jgi:hypothetical protein
MGRTRHKTWGAPQCVLDLFDEDYGYGVRESSSDVSVLMPIRYEDAISWRAYERFMLETDLYLPFQYIADMTLLTPMRYQVSRILDEPELLAAGAEALLAHAWHGCFPRNRRELDFVLDHDISL